MPHLSIYDRITIMALDKSTREFLMSEYWSTDNSVFMSPIFIRDCSNEYRSHSPNHYTGSMYLDTMALILGCRKRLEHVKFAGDMLDPAISFADSTNKSIQAIHYFTLGGEKLTPYAPLLKLYICDTIGTTSLQNVLTKHLKKYGVYADKYWDIIPSIVKKHPKFTATKWKPYKDIAKRMIYVAGVPYVLNYDNNYEADFLKKRRTVIKNKYFITTYSPQKLLRDIRFASETFPQEWIVAAVDEIFDDIANKERYYFEFLWTFILSTKICSKRVFDYIYDNCNIHNVYYGIDTHAEIITNTFFNGFLDNTNTPKWIQFDLFMNIWKTSYE